MTNALLLAILCCLCPMLPRIALAVLALCVLLVLVAAAVCIALKWAFLLPLAVAAVSASVVVYQLVDEWLHARKKTLAKL